MRKCIYCGHAVGPLHGPHATCREIHHTAVNLIPKLFQDIFKSATSSEAFVKLLNSTATAAFVKMDELQSLCRSGITDAVDRILADRLLTSEEEQRLSEIAAEFPSMLDGVPEFAEKLVKIAILCELRDHKTPERVHVVGPVPIKLGREIILWISNHVRLYRPPLTITSMSRPEAPVPLVYQGYSAFKRQLHFDQSALEASGDFVLTNRSSYFLTQGIRPIRIPLQRIIEMKPYNDCLAITWETNERQSGIFALPDAWFVYNVMMLLRRGRGAA